MKNLITILIILLLPYQLCAEELNRFITMLKLPTGQIVVIAEGEFEARSIGSFSVRLYEAASDPDETTFFISGLIHPRDGSIENVSLKDITDDHQPEIIVIARSVGTGNYLAAYAFTFEKKGLSFQIAVEGVSPDANPIQVLKEKLDGKI
jgi:hypothetical protein